MNKHATAVLFLVTFFFSKSSSLSINAGEDSDVREHLSTVTRYGVVNDIPYNSFVPSDIPEGCVPIHLNLLARHGTRFPTVRKIGDLDVLEGHLKSLISDTEKQHTRLDRIPSWLRGWESPWKRAEGGELMAEGVEELYHLGIRTRQKFPNLFYEEYQPDIYPITASHIHRTLASAEAFAEGLFSVNASFGPGNHPAFAVNVTDELLRFFDYCNNTKNFRDTQKDDVDKHKAPILGKITSALVRRYGLNFTTQDTSSFWLLCKEEASLLHMTNQACSLFSSFEITVLEWMDDLNLYILRGYGKSMNYRMGIALLEDVFESMEQAIRANKEKQAPGSYEKARLRFAHAETLVPFSCMLGLFLEGSEFEQIQKEQLLKLPHDPQKRKWRGSLVAPFAGNSMLILYSCPAKDKSTSSYFVRVLHNEHPIPMPACHNSDFCPYELFKEKVYTPHTKHTFDTVCNGKVDDTGDDFSPLFQWPFDDDTRRDEL